MAENPKPVTAWVCWCEVGCGWESNVCLTEEDAKSSLAFHLAEVHSEPEEADGG